MRETPFGNPDDRDISETGRSGGDPGPLLGSITVPRRPAAVAMVRRFVAAALGDRPETDTALLLTSEAVTNSVIHTAGATVTVTVVEIAGGLRFEVTDGGAATVPTMPAMPAMLTMPAMPAMPTARDGCDLREDGRGVFLLGRLSARCGFHGDDSGLTYWFEL
jgi:anti-sigma regulatory factor (Ser/Thr protein kinase)